MTIWLLPALGVGAVILLSASVLLYRSLLQEERLYARLRLVQQSGDQSDNGTATKLPGFLRAITALGEAMARSGLLSSRTIEELQQTLRISGFKGGHGLGLFVGAKLLLMVMLPLAAFMVPRMMGWETTYQAAMFACAGAVGMLAPDFIVRSRRKQYLKRLELGLPDALDLLVICSQAGLGLETSVDRVASEIRLAHPAVADELTFTANEMRLNADTRLALVNLGTRTGLENLKRLSAVLVQTIQYGTPVSQALRSLSAEQRADMLARFEAKAARLPVLLTLPMILFILPCVFLVVAGPAVVQVLKTISF